MFKRFLAVLMAMCICMSLPTAAFAAEVEPTTTDTVEAVSTETEKFEVVVGGKEETVVTMPMATGGDVAVPYSATYWDKLEGETVGTFTMEGNNLTPVKTIGVKGAWLCIRVDEYVCSKPVILTVKIREAYSSKVLGDIAVSELGKTGKVEAAMAEVDKGDQVQISFRITDANGNYDDNLECKITYSYFYVGSCTGHD